MDKKPPIEKIYEAYSAIADRRVGIDGNSAAVRSSSGEKEYKVQWDKNIYSSTDNATFWQHYPGYPVIAVLMLQGTLPFDRKIARYFSGINWTELNLKHKRNYAASVAEVMESIKAIGGDVDKINGDIANVYEELCALDIKIKRGKK
jgi:hypothetical protein